MRKNKGDARETDLLDYPDAATLFELRWAMFRGIYTENVPYAPPVSPPMALTRRRQRPSATALLLLIASLVTTALILCAIVAS